MIPAKINFPVFESFAHGLRMTMRHARLFTILSAVPFLSAFMTMMALRFMGGANVFWLPIVQIPSSFVMGLQCALILRFLVLQEFPLVADEAQRRARNRQVIEAGAVYAIVTYLLSGIMAGLIWLRPLIVANPEAAAPYMPLAMTGLVLIFWGARWFWLHVPISLGWDVKGLYARLKGWPGSMRVLGLFVMCSLTVNFIVRLLRTIIAVLGGATGPQDTLGGIAAALDDAAVSAGSVLLGVLFSAATAYAVKSMIGQKTEIVV